MIERDNPRYEASKIKRRRWDAVIDKEITALRKKSKPLIWLGDFNERRMGTPRSMSNNFPSTTKDRRAFVLIVALMLVNNQSKVLCAESGIR